MKKSVSSLLIVAGIFTYFPQSNANTIAGIEPTRVFASESGDYVVRIAPGKTPRCLVLAFDPATKGYTYQSGFVLLQRHVPFYGLVNTRAKRIFLAWDYVQDLEKPILSIYDFDGALIKDIYTRDVFTEAQAKIFKNNPKGADITWLLGMLLDRDGSATIETTVRDEAGINLFAFIDVSGVVRHELDHP